MKLNVKNFPKLFLFITFSFLAIIISIFSFNLLSPNPSEIVNNNPNIHSNSEEINQKSPVYGDLIINSAMSVTGTEANITLTDFQNSTSTSSTVHGLRLSNGTVISNVVDDLSVGSKTFFISGLTFSTSYTFILEEKSSGGIWYEVPGKEITFKTNDNATFRDFSISEVDHSMAEVSLYFVNGRNDMQVNAMRLSFNGVLSNEITANLGTPGNFNFIVNDLSEITDYTVTVEVKTVGIDSWHTIDGYEWNLVTKNIKNRAVFIGVVVFGALLFGALVVHIIVKILIKKNVIKIKEKKPSIEE